MLNPNIPVDTEAHFIGLLLDRTNLLDNFSSNIIDMFGKFSNQLILKAIFELHQRGKTIDIVTVTEQLKLNGDLERCGGIVYVTSLCNLGGFGGLSAAQEYLDIICDYYTRRKANILSQELAEMANSDNINGHTIYNYVERELEKYHASDALLRQKTSDNIFINYIDRSHKIREAGGIPAIKTGFGLIDNYMTAGGLERNNLYILGARPSMGKSALATNIASYVALNGGSVVFISFEMPWEQVSSRIISADTMIRYDHVFNTSLATETEYQKIIDACSSYKDKLFYFINQHGMTPSEIEIAARRWKEQHEKKLDLIVVDHLHLMDGDGKAETKALEIAEMTKRLKGMAGSLDVPVLCLTQLNRAVEMRPNKRPILSDIRASGSVEQDADVVLFLYRDSYYRNDTDEPYKAELSIAKNRCGRIGNIDLYFIPELTKFVENEQDVSQYYNIATAEQRNIPYGPAPKNGDDDVMEF